MFVKTIKILIVFIPLFFLAALTYQRSCLFYEPKNVWLESLKNDPNNYFSNILLAQLYWQEDKLKPAWDCYVKANETNQYDPKPFRGMIWITYLKGDIDKVLLQIKDYELKFGENEMVTKIKKTTERIKNAKEAS